MEEEFVLAVSDTEEVYNEEPKEKEEQSKWQKWLAKILSKKQKQ